MLNSFFQSLMSPMDTFSFILLIITGVLHIVFAGAVAKDAGQLTKTGFKLALVSGMTWAFATLVGGVFVAAIYWVIHHSNLTLNVSPRRDKQGG